MKFKRLLSSGVRLTDPDFALTSLDWTSGGKLAGKRLASFRGPTGLRIWERGPAGLVPLHDLQEPHQQQLLSLRCGSQWLWAFGFGAESLQPFLDPDIESQKVHTLCLHTAFSEFFHHRFSVLRPPKCQ